MPFMHHIPNLNYVYIDVEREAMENVFHFLKEKLQKPVFISPNKEEYQRYITGNAAVIIRVLISEAPLQNIGDLSITTIEKILVDIIGDIEFHFLQGAEISHFYHNVLDKHNINKKKLIRYATRRGRREQVEQLYKTHYDTTRISIHQMATKIAKKNNFPNITILEKAVRAFSLLESLALSGCPFIFKGGTALMLHLNNPKRLSIDIDIICPPGTKIESYLNQNAGQYGFNKIELVERHTEHTIPKSHVKFHYQVAYKTNNVTDYILLDVLFENNHYNKLVSLPIENQFLKTAGEKIFVQTPIKEDILGDKLTAFAPNTTGIPYYKKGQLYTMEIIKQLYDIASLFDFTNDLSTTTDTFYKYAKIELAYRSLDVNNVQQVLDDIFQTSLCICLKGQTNKEQFFFFKMA